MTVALTLGKFAPLHRGHQLVIDSAIAECDHVVVLVYDAPSTTAVPLSVRARWIRSLYPQVEVIEGHGAPEATGDKPEIRALQERYIRSVIGDRSISRFYSSEFYGAHVARALGAEDRRVDPDRRRIPVSGSAIRQDPWRYRALVDPLVYCDLITRVVFVGAPSTGKTTIARRMAELFDTVWMPEYGREYWDRHQVDRRLTQEQLVEIAEGHLAREERLVLEANRYLFVDTDATTTLMFARDYHGEGSPRLAQLAEGAGESYHLRFLCLPDFPFDATWDRADDSHQRRFQELIRDDLLRRGLPFHELEGPVADRVERVRAELLDLGRLPAG